MKLLLFLLLVAVVLISYGVQHCDGLEASHVEAPDSPAEMEITDKQYLEGDLSYDGDCVIRCQQGGGYYPGKGNARLEEIIKNQRHADPKRYRVYCECRVPLH